MDKVKNILVLQSRIEILVTVPGLGHGVPVCGFHTQPWHMPYAIFSIFVVCYMYIRNVDPST